MSSRPKIGGEILVGCVSATPTHRRAKARANWRPQRPRYEHLKINRRFWRLMDGPSANDFRKN